jgi:hypothetical protein
VLETVAIVVLLLLQVPPGLGSLNGVVVPWHKVVVPVIASGIELTVTVTVAVPAALE